MGLKPKSSYFSYLFVSFRELAEGVADSESKRSRQGGVGLVGRGPTPAFDPGQEATAACFIGTESNNSGTIAFHFTSSLGNTFETCRLLYSKDQDSSKKKPIIIYFKDLFCRLRSNAYSYLCWPTKILEIACRLWVTNSLVIRWTHCISLFMFKFS